MLYSVRDSINRAWFSLQCKGVFNTPAATIHPDSNLVVLTQLQHKDVLMAALAFKSFARQAPVGAFYIVNDGSLTLDDRAILKEHIPGVTFFDVDDFRSPLCPRGGCWERLLAIAELSRTRFVVQLDSDTLTLAAIPEVCAAVKENRSFAISTWDNQELESMRSRQEHATRIVDGNPAQAHVQVLSEAHFDRLRGFGELKYVRGCAGFSGFGRQSFDRQFIEEISSEMFSAIGDRWAEWGSEQVMSNIVVANSRGALSLPHPKYCDCTKIRDRETVFVHFIGTCRFNHNTYARYARGLIRQTLSAHC